MGQLQILHIGLVFKIGASVWVQVATYVRCLFKLSNDTSNAPLTSKVLYVGIRCDFPFYFLLGFAIREKWFCRAGGGGGLWSHNEDNDNCMVTRLGCSAFSGAANQQIRVLDLYTAISQHFFCASDGHILGDCLQPVGLLSPCWAKQVVFLLAHFHTEQNSGLKKMSANCRTKLQSRAGSWNVTERMWLRA